MVSVVSNFSESLWSLLSLRLAREDLRDERDAETKETTGRQQGRCVNHVVAYAKLLKFPKLLKLPNLPLGAHYNKKNRSTERCSTRGASATVLVTKPAPPLSEHLLLQPFDRPSNLKLLT